MGVANGALDWLGAGAAARADLGTFSVNGAVSDASAFADAVSAAAMTSKVTSLMCLSARRPCGMFRMDGRHVEPMLPCMKASVCRIATAHAVPVAHEGASAHSDRA